MARSGALVPLLVGGGIAAVVVYAMTRDAKAKDDRSLPPGDGDAFEPLPSGALPEETLAKYLQALTMPTNPDELMGLIDELAALGAHYEAAQVREVLGAGGGLLPTGAIPPELQDAFATAIYQPETFSHADLLDLADDLDQAGANYEAEQIRDLAAALHGVEPPAPGGGDPLADPGGPPVGLPEDVVPPPGGGFVPPGTFPQNSGGSLWDQLAQGLGQIVPPNMQTPIELPQPPAGQQGQPPPAMPGTLPPVEPPAGAAGGSSGSYEIKAGDTLWQLASARLGDLRRWDELVALNIDQYDAHPDWGLVLHPGDVIRVPPDFR